MEVILEGRAEAFQTGINALRVLAGGANVQLVSGPVTLKTPENVQRIENKIKIQSLRTKEELIILVQTMLKVG